MINIQKKEASKIKSALSSLYISFAYNVTFVNKIKELSQRFYHPKDRQWEVPENTILQLLNIFKGEEITMTGMSVNSDIVPITAPAKEVVKEVINEGSIKEYKSRTNPFPHQLESFSYSFTHTKFLLGDEQGLGKTKQAIDIAASHKGEFKHCLIVCGVNGLKYNWLNEVKKHSYEEAYILGSYLDKKGRLQVGSVADRLADLDSDIDEYFLITNIETIRSYSLVPDKKGKKVKRFLMQEKIEELCKNDTLGMAIIDEVHKAKNAQTDQGKAIHCLNTKYKMALTGTPLMNAPLDLYNVLKWLEVEQASFYSFRKYYCIMGGFGGYDVVSYRNLEKLRNRLDSVMLRRKKAEVLSLPPKIWSEEYVEMSNKQAKIYNEVKDAIIANIDEIKLSPNPLAQLIRLRQATGYTGLLSSSIKESAKMDRLEELVEEITDNGGKVIVFSNWTGMTDELLIRLRQYQPAVITGNQKVNRYEEEVRFQNDDNCQVIIGTISAMGTGLNLTAATTVIFLDSPWNMATKEQAWDRAHRIGTLGTVNIITLITKDTIDERVEEIIAEKGLMADALVDGNMEKLANTKLVDRLLA